MTEIFFQWIYTLWQHSDGMTHSDEDKMFQKPTKAVVRLSACTAFTNRNITPGTSFSSVELVKVLKEKI